MLLATRLRRQLRPRGRSRTSLVRLAVLATVCFAAALYVLAWFGASESALLERHMNSGPLAYPLHVVKSSVDWAAVRYRHPPRQQLVQLPKPTGRDTLPRIQHQFGKESKKARKKRQDRRKSVLRLAMKSWDSYRIYAWKKDALLPLSKSGRDQFSGWAATLVDSLDTLWIMGLRDEFDEAAAAVAQIDFGSSTSRYVNVFETNIRYLGGLLAAYDLSKRKVLLQKAIELGDLIYGAFNTANRMPVDNLDFEAAKDGSGLVVEDSVVSASPGTLTLELTRLSQVTGNPKYYDAITDIVDLFYRGQNQTALPGLFPMYVSMRREDVTTGDIFTISGNADSAYEYFPKMHALLSGADPKYARLTRGFMDAAKDHLFYRPMVPDNDDILMSGNVNVDGAGNPELDPETEHLSCFIGGTFALAGRLLNSEEDVEVGARLTRGCAYAYKSFATGIMPERLNMVPCEPGKPCKWDEDRWVAERKKRPEYKPHLPKGFTTAKDPRYLLRPEAIESVFVMYRITGDSSWQDVAWDMFRAVASGTATELGSASLTDVTVSKWPLPLEDYMEVGSSRLERRQTLPSTY